MTNKIEEMHKLILTKNLRRNIQWKNLINKNGYLTIPNIIVKLKLCIEVEKHINRKKYDTYIEYYADDEEYYDEIFRLNKNT
jgi:hypothetical protein